jgi:hypothetical protein
MDILMLDIVVIVVPAEDVITEVGVLKSMYVGQMATSPWFELVKLVSHVWGIADESG